MRKKRAQKNVSFHIEMSLVNGIPKTNALNSGISSTAKKHIGEHFRVFPLSNWTEMDVWQYIKLEELALPSIYFSHEREVVHRNGLYLANSEFLTLGTDEVVEKMIVRCRTVGDMTCTGVVASPARNVDDIIAEVAAARVTERGGRVDDKRSETAMEDRKKDGYF